MSRRTSTPQAVVPQRTLRKLLFNAVVMALFALSPMGAAAQALFGRVIGISDGDTITVLDAQNQPHKVRLASIDAPERKQPFGNVSRQHLAQHVFQRDVRVDYSKRDRYGRLVGTVWLAGEDMNLKQIEAGLAWHFTKYASEQSEEQRERYAASQLAARAARLGLWREADPIAPWQFREERRSAAR